MSSPITPLTVPDLCCGCGEVFTKCTKMNSSKPGLLKPGDFSLCSNCGQLHRMGEDGFLLEAHDSDLGDLPVMGIIQIKGAQYHIRERGLLVQPRADYDA